MNLYTITALLVTATAGISTASTDVNSRDDVILASIAALSSSMNGKFGRLELKVNQIIAKQNNRGECSEEGNTIDDINPSDSQEGKTQPDLVATDVVAHLKKLSRLETLVSALASVPSCLRTAARVPRPMILAAPNTSQSISCQSSGQPLNSCVWGHSGRNGTRQTIIVDRAIIENNRTSVLSGVSYLADEDGLAEGNCTFSIQTVTESQWGLWSCTLVSNDSTILSGAVHVGLLSQQDQLMTRPEVECETDQMKVLKIFKNIFDDQQNCAPCAASDATLKTKLIAAEKKFRQNQRTIKDLTRALMAPAIQKRKARMPQTKVVAKADTSVVLSCESHDGQSWSTCLWVHKPPNGQRRVIIIDQQMSLKDGQTELQGISYVGVGEGLIKDGKCELRIESTAERDYGEWKCTLIGENETSFTGELQIHDDEIPPSIYIATNKGGILSYSMETPEVSQILSNSEEIYGIAYDPIDEKLYWSTTSKIYRGNRSLGYVETLLDTSQYGLIQLIDFDWIAGNLYVATWGGFILSCDAKPANPFRCATVLSGRGNLAGITLDPNKGTMYWSKFDGSAGSISQSGMDGSNPVEIVTGLNRPVGVTIDFTSSRLYWTCAGNSKVQSSDMHGTDVQTVYQFPSGSWTFGITIHAGRIYCTNYSSKDLQSFTTTGQDLQLLHTADTNFLQLAVVSSVTPRSRSRVNHCEQQNCSNVCVLSSTSFRCIA